MQNMNNAREKHENSTRGNPAIPVKKQEIPDKREAIPEENQVIKTVDPKDNKILCGFWFEWQPIVELTEIPIEYNVVCVAFIEQEQQAAIPTFTPIFHTDEYFIDGIRKLKSEGREVLISIGGTHGDISIKEKDKTAFKNELIRIIDKYGFTGIDIDLEGESVKAADNQTVIPETLREIKDYYRSNLCKKKDFMITMAPEFIDLRGYEAGYKPYIADLEGYYDIIFPQYYNQGADGIWSDEYNMFLSQNDDAHKSEFLYTLTNAIVTGTQDYVKIPANKFAIGLPASPDAALNGYVKNPNDVITAMKRLAAEGNEIRGLMTWSVNYDSANGYEFMRRYAPFIFQ